MRERGRGVHPWVDKESPLFINRTSEVIKKNAHFYDSRLVIHCNSLLLLLGVGLHCFISTLSDGGGSEAALAEEGKELFNSANVLEFRKTD